MSFFDDEKYANSKTNQMIYTLFSSGKLWVDKSGRIFNKDDQELTIISPDDNYPFIAISVGQGKIFRISVHRVVGYAIYGKKIFLKHMSIDHRDNNRYNNHPDNLALITRRENVNKDTFLKRKLKDKHNNRYQHDKPEPF